MKKLILFVGFLLIYFTSFSQSVGIGSSSFTPGSTLSIDGNVSIGNSYRATANGVTNGLIVAGNVGIGTSTASYVLDVLGVSRIYSGAGGDNGVYFNPGGLPAGKSGIAIGYNQTYNGTAMTNAGFFQAESQGVGYRNIVLQPFGANVGIGTTSPSALLSLGQSVANTKLALYDDGANYYGFGIQSNQFRFHVYSSSADFIFLDAPAGNTLVTIKGGGNVGIGSTSPGAKLDVAYAGSTNTYAGKILHSGNSGSPGTALTVSNGYATTSGSGSYEIFGVYSNSFGTSNLTVKDQGYVGIGTATPASKLNINASSVVSGSTLGEVIIVDGTNSQANQSVSGINVEFSKSASGGNFINGIRARPTATHTSGTITNMYGIIGIPHMNGTGGTVTNAYGVFARIDNTAGTITNGYGIYVENDQIATGTNTNRWAFYSASTYKSYFAGNVGIGTSTPTYILDVGDRIRLRAGANGTAGQWLYNGTTDVGFIGDLGTGAIGLWGNTGAGWGLQMNTTTGAVTLANNLTVTGDLTVSGGELNGSINTQWIQTQIDNGYNVGTSALRYSSIHGVTFWGAYNAGPDVAEMYPSVKHLEPGTLVSWDEENDFNVREAIATDVFSLAGVISSNPGVKLSDLTGYDSTGYPLALCGRVPVKISAENGVVKTGDPLTVSKKFPGMVMKATESCRIVGTALESFDGSIKESKNVYKHMIKPNTKPAPFEPQASADGTGKIMMFVKVEWYDAEKAQVGQLSK